VVWPFKSLHAPISHRKQCSPEVGLAKYRQHGYQDSDRSEKREKREPRERTAPLPRPARQDQIGPRTPHMVGTVMRTRCSICGNALVPSSDPKAKCPKCGFELHCCKQCVHFDTSARFECTQPIIERIPKKDALNDCKFYECRVTVEKDTAPIAPPAPAAVQREYSGSAARPTDARRAFDDLFKK
jgi:hypothetical protein